MDKIYSPLEMVEVSSFSDVPTPDTGFQTIFTKDGLAYIKRDDGEIRELTNSLMKKVAYYQTTTNSSGQWWVGISGFASVEFVTPIAIRETGSINDQSVAVLHAYDNSSANGRVIESNGLALGGQGLEYAPAGVVVRVRVEGTYPATGVIW